VIRCSINNGEAGDNDGVVENDNGGGDRDEVDDKDD